MTPELSPAAWPPPLAELRVVIEDWTVTRRVPVPDRFRAEADRRMASPPTPDGQRHCLNHCCHPFYAWVREATAALYTEVREEYLAAHPDMARWQVPATLPIPAHPHGAQAPHWFAPLLEDTTG
jgi:hypothetical protein